MNLNIAHVSSSPCFNDLNPDTKQKMERLFKNVSDVLSQNETFCSQLAKVDAVFMGSASEMPLNVETTVRAYLIKAFNYSRKLASFHLFERGASAICANTLAHVIDEKFHCLSSLNSAPALRISVEDLKKRQVKEAHNYKMIYGSLIFGGLRFIVQNLAEISKDCPEGISLSITEFLSEEDMEVLLLTDEFINARLRINGVGFRDAESVLAEIRRHGGLELKECLPQLEALLQKGREAISNLK